MEIYYFINFISIYYVLYMCNWSSPTQGQGSSHKPKAAKEKPQHQMCDISPSKDSQTSMDCDHCT